MQDLADDVHGGVIEDCGHYVMEEQPTETARQMLVFMDYGGSCFWQLRQIARTLYSAVAGLPMMWLRRVFAGIFDLSSTIETWLRSHGS